VKDVQLRKFVDKEKEKYPKSQSGFWLLIARGLRVNRSETVGESHFENFS
jgi:hypothetical protein